MSNVVKSMFNLDPNSMYCFIIKSSSKISGKFIEDNGRFILIMTKNGVEEILKDNIYFYYKLKENSESFYKLIAI